ncbi:MAG: glycosyltransferase [Chthoniobacteraceae bacterium]
MLPVAAQYVVTFLKPEMLHVYRQITALNAWRPVVFCQRRENVVEFPFDSLVVLPKPWSHQLRRLWQKTILRRPITIYRSEAQRTLAALRRAEARVLHVWFGHIGVHLLPLLEIANLPVIVSFHGADAGVGWDRAGMERVFSLATLLLVRSESLAERLVAHGAPREKIRVQRTGVPLDQISFFERSAPADGSWQCLQTCRLIPKKGLATSLRAFEKFAGRWPHARFTIAGEGPQREALERLAGELGIAGRVRFAGFVPQAELRRLEADAHLFLHPSEVGADGDQEGVPNAMLEAMASGLPVCATHHGGIPEAVEHGVSGLLVPERDADALAEQMLGLAGSPEWFARMSAAAAKRVGDEFDLVAQTRRLEANYAEACARAGRAGAA